MARQSLSRKITIPILLAVLLATILVSVASSWIAEARYVQETERRFARMGRTIQQSNFPLNQSVLQILADLTGAHWMAVDAEGRIVALARAPDEGPPWTDQEQVEWARLLQDTPHWAPDVPATRQRLRDTWYQTVRFARKFPRGAADQPAISSLIVLLDDRQRERSVRQSLLGPLLVGLAAIGIVATVTLVTTARWAKRVGHLQRDVNAIARGQFDTPIRSDGDDELSHLARDVTAMAGQIEEMWQRFRRLQSEQMLHQISGGLAHNLRNTLTGARMAVELAQQRIAPVSGSGKGAAGLESLPESLQVAMNQLDQAEAYIRRILLAAGGQRQEHCAARVIECLQTLQATLTEPAKHRGKNLVWAADFPTNLWVEDGQTLIAAISNLIWNGLEAGQRVWVQGVPLTGISQAQIVVTDDGPGPPDEVVATLFEPFVSTKDDGIGLGLALVYRAAKALGGDIQWHRLDQQTIFTFTFRCFLRSDPNDDRISD